MTSPDAAATSVLPSATVEPNEPAPQPPVEPALEDCCGSGCDPCIFELFERQRERYQEDLAAWKQRQEARQATAQRPALGKTKRFTDQAR